MDLIYKKRGISNRWQVETNRMAITGSYLHNALSSICQRMPNAKP